MELLWKIIQDGSGVVPTVSEKAFTQLCTLLTHNDCQLQREPYLEKCIDKLSAGESVPQSLNLAQRILNSFQVKRRKKVIEQLDQKFKLVDVFLKELATYKRAAQKAVQQATTQQPAVAGDAEKKDKKKLKRRKDGDTTSSESSGSDGRRVVTVDVNTLPVGKTKIPHLEHIKLRLEFLEYILTNSAIIFSPATVRAFTPFCFNPGSCVVCHYSLPFNPYRWTLYGK